MPFELHTVEVPDQSASQTSGNGLSMPDRVIFAKLDSVANAAGAAGATVSTTVHIGYELPANYAVQVTPSQKAFVWVDTKTTTSFVVHMAPDTGTDSIAAGTFDVLVVA